MSALSVDMSLLPIISLEQALQYRVLPYKQVNEVLYLITDRAHDNNNVKAELELIIGSTIELIQKETEAVEDSINFYYNEQALVKHSAEVLKGDAMQGDFLTRLIKEARSLKCSDIHIESYDIKSRIRLRVDGKLIEKFNFDKSEYSGVINRIKIMAGLDISEKRLPQDGRILFGHNDEKFDIRVSVLPTLYGEKIVLRILGSSAASLDLSEIGFSAVDFDRYQTEIRKPTGIILISGPTGSGKTTTLYATLKMLNKTSENILTIEDPIEYTLEGINQVQVKEDIGLTFAKALRSFLRQDPDVIMVGEIRDGEAAQLAIRAALTGHLVLSTIHTNSAWGTIARLIDMGIPPFLLAETINVSVAQRLVRILCEKCKKSERFSSSMFPGNFSPLTTPTNHFVAVGCKSCLQTGYKGRVAIYEVIPIDKQTTEFIIDSDKNSDVYFKSRGIKTLQENAYNLFLDGKTTISEIYPFLLNNAY